MTPSFFPSQPYNRREFILASGIVVAGGLVTCAKLGEPAAPTKSKTTPNAQSTPITIRVRIGRIRDDTTVVIGDAYISRKNKRWSTTNTNLKTTNDGGVLEFTGKKDTLILINTTSKKISNDVHLVARVDISPCAFDVVAYVPIEQYLPGVLAGELFAHWHQETFIAQAVAARSYATAQHISRKATSHFDVDDGPSSQMFLGDVTLDVAHRASEESAGIILTWNSDVIPAYYCACCGGVAATATDAISGSVIHDIPPLQGHDGVDSCEPLDIRSWSATRSSRTIRKRMNICGTTMNLPELGRIRTISSIEPTETNQHGRPTKLAVYDRKKNATMIRARDLVRVLNAKIQHLPLPTPAIWSSNLIANKNGANVDFLGSGMGHGVGLCQYGAQELAGKGESWENILAWYYPKATIT